MQNDQIVVINESIKFELQQRQDRGARSFEALDLVAEAIKAHPEIKRIEVAGHTDNVGPRDVNMESLAGGAPRRSSPTWSSKGIDPAASCPNGYGPDKPVASNDTDEGRAKNRRVQFNILMMFK